MPDFCSYDCITSIGLPLTPWPLQEATGLDLGLSNISSVCPSCANPQDWRGKLFGSQQTEELKDISQLYFWMGIWNVILKKYSELDLLMQKFKKKLIKLWNSRLGFKICLHEHSVEKIIFFPHKSLTLKTCMQPDGSNKWKDHPRDLCSLG